MVALDILIKQYVDSGAVIIVCGGASDIRVLQDHHKNFPINKVNANLRKGITRIRNLLEEEHTLVFKWEYIDEHYHSEDEWGKLSPLEILTVSVTWNQKIS